MRTHTQSGAFSARTFLAAILAGLLAAVLPVSPMVSAHPNSEQELTPEDVRHLPSPIGGYLLYDDNGKIGCRMASPHEMPRHTRAYERGPVKPIRPSPENRGAQTGLDLVLLPTAQLEANPVAMEAYARAEATWESLIATPITVVIDVDYGPTNFGVPWDPGILGSTDPQFSLDEGFITLRTYSSTRPRLIARTNSSSETALLNALPATSVPTTAGNCTTIVICTAVQRALGFLSASADPAADYLPSVALNSNVAYDFDPSDGIDADKQDFNATALHEIGHALGFNSWTGILELAPDFPIILSTWDLYRFRPGITDGAFGTAQRVLASGGEQLFFDGSATYRLSTGRPDFTGGDEQQASHWKDNVLNSGVYIGIMDPTGADGDLDEITDADLIALDLMGYEIRRGPALSNVTATFAGNMLSISGTASSPLANATQARLTLFNPAGADAGTPPSVAVNIPVGTTQAFDLDFDLTNFRAATQADLTFVDATGGESVPERINFGAADSGGSTLSNITFPGGKKLKVTGVGLTGATVEINGVVVSPPITFKVKGGGTKGTLKGNASQLGLQTGPNRVRVSIGNTKSNIFVLTI